MNGVTAGVIFVTFLPKTLPENMPKDTQDFVSSTSSGNTAYMDEVKEIYSCLQGNFVIMGTWGHINLFSN